MANSKRALRSLLIVGALVLIGSAIPMKAQDIDSPSVGIFGGAGAVKNEAFRGALQAGGSYEQSNPNHWMGYMFEGGYTGPFSNLKGGSALLSFDYVPSWQANRNSRWLPFAAMGYTRLFGTGNAFNFGGGVDLRIGNGLGIRVEGRDYYGFSHGHDFAIRVGLRKYIPD